MGSWLSYDIFDDMFITSHQTKHVHNQSKYEPRLMLDQRYDNISYGKLNHVGNVRDGREHTFDLNMTSCNKADHYHAGDPLTNDHGANTTGDH